MKHERLERSDEIIIKTAQSERLLPHERGSAVSLLGPTALLFLIALVGAGSLAWQHADVFVEPLLYGYSKPTLNQLEGDLPNIARLERRVLSVQEPGYIEEIMRDHRASIERLSAVNERFAVAMHREAWVCTIAPSDMEAFVAALSENDRRHRAVFESLHALIVAEIAAQQRRAERLDGGNVRWAIEKNIIELDELLYELSKDRAHAYAVLDILTKLGARLQSIGRVCRDGERSPRPFANCPPLRRLSNAIGGGDVMTRYSSSTAGGSRKASASFCSTSTVGFRAPRSMPETYVRCSSHSKAKSSWDSPRCRRSRRTF